MVGAPPPQDRKGLIAFETNAFEEFKFHLVAQQNAIPLHIIRESEDWLSGGDRIRISLFPTESIKAKTLYHLVAVGPDFSLNLSTFETTDFVDTTAPTWLGVSKIEVYEDWCRAGTVVDVDIFEPMDNFNGSQDIHYELYLHSPNGLPEKEASEYFRYPTVWFSFNSELGERVRSEGINKLSIRPIDRSGNRGQPVELTIDLTEPPYVFE